MAQRSMVLGRCGFFLSAPENDLQAADDEGAFHAGSRRPSPARGTHRDAP